MRDQNGFTLIELMFVVAIIGILAAIAVPNFSAYRARAYEAEGYALADELRQEVCRYYDTLGVLPADNEILGLPEPDAIRGKYVSSLTIHQGTVEIRFDPELRSPTAGKLLRLVPKINQSNPTGPLIWEIERPDNS